MTPREGVLVIGFGQISHIVKMHFLIKNLLLPLGIEQRTEYIFMMITEGSTKIVRGIFDMTFLRQ